MKGPQDILFGSRGYPKAKRAHCRNDGGRAASWRARARGSGKVAAVIQVKGVNEAARMAAFQVGQVVPGRDR